MDIKETSILWTDQNGEHLFVLEKGTYIIGRDKLADIVIDHRGVSRQHAVLTIREGSVRFKDLESSTGSSINGIPVKAGEEKALANGDRFSLGRIGFILTESKNHVEVSDEIVALNKETSETGILLNNLNLVQTSLEKLLKDIPESDHILQKMIEMNERIEKHLVQYQVLQKVTQTLGQILDIKTMLKTALHLVGSELGADRGFIILYDAAIHKMNSMVTWHFDLNSSTTQHDYSFSQTLANESVKTGKILILDNAMKDPKFNSAHSILASRILSVICIPLYRGTETLGVIYLDSLSREGQFQSVHEDFLKTFARQTSMALHNAKLYTQAVTDDLSGLFLRKYMEQRIKEELARSQRHQRPCCLLMIDIDFFKHINDTYGHPAGDEVITEVAQRLQSTAREMDVVGRYGGEEFIMLLPETVPSGALIVAERIRKLISRATFERDGHVFSVTISIGVVSSNSIDSYQPLPFIRAADDALYRAKSSGRNRTVMYEPD
ncbi:MAG: hypothetical protein CSA81_01755 [Acidobacteria bacterium]|nr:MAG: hypothetical protein CSA81_01755 [Acidobacteriota bacterium]